MGSLKQLTEYNQLEDQNINNEDELGGTRKAK